jgi:hypothetical protein
LSAADLEFFRQAKMARAFHHLNHEPVQQVCAETDSNDILLVMCGDCNHSDDKIGHLKTTFPNTRRHLHAWNGGGLLLDGVSPANQLGMNGAAFCQFQILQSLKVKPKIRQIFLETHFPCAVALAAGMSVRQQIESMLHSKRHLKERARHELHMDVKIGLLFHLYLDGMVESEARRMYHYSLSPNSPTKQPVP